MDLLNSLTGNVTKAVISFEDKRKEMAKYTVEESWDVKEGGGQSFKSGAIKGPDGNVQSFVSAEKLGAELDSISSGVSGNKRSFKVKFNPSSLTISAMGGGRYANTDYSAGNNKLSYGAIKTMLQLNCKLIFDEYDYGDTFSNPTANLSVSNLAGKVKGLITKSDHSVQKQVEAFTGALRNRYTRYCTFSWGKMSYTGVVNRIDATYTLFSTTGKPERAVVNFGMQCMDKEAEGAVSQQWKESFNRVLKNVNEDTLEYDTTNSTDFLQNILNMNF